MDNDPPYFGLFLALTLGVTITNTFTMNASSFLELRVRYSVCFLVKAYGFSDNMQYDFQLRRREIWQQIKKTVWYLGVIIHFLSLQED